MTDRLPIAAVIFDRMDPVDDLLAQVLADWPGRHVVGWLQRYQDTDACDCHDMVLHALRDGRTRNITQNLGAGSQGCRLDTTALAEVAGWLAEEVREGPELLVLNRFGKIEAEGGGMRAVLEQALAADIPILVPVNRKHLTAWRDYSEGLAIELPHDGDALRAWLSEVLGQA